MTGPQRIGLAADCVARGPTKAGAIPVVLVSVRPVGLVRRSRIGLYVAVLSVGTAAKARVFEVPGAGGLVMTESVEGLGEYFDCENELVTFTGIGELAARVRQLLERPDERDRIARAGHERVRREHTYRMRFAALIARAESAHRAAPGAVPDLGAAERAHRAGPLLHALRWVLATPARWVWGPRRGPRAARRLLYELSWRWAGARTFSARGLPGRLFYRES